MSAPEALPITRAPRFLAICEAYEPTPPAAPWIRMVIPGLAATTSRTICSAVDPAVGSAAAVVKSIEFGMAATVDPEQPRIRHTCPARTQTPYHRRQTG